MAGWTLRRARVEEAPGWAACMRAAYAPLQEKFGPLPPLEADYADEIARHEVWVAEREGQIAGSLVLMPGEDFLTLANVAVHPESHGKGFGRALIDLAETRASQLGYPEIRLNAHAAMTGNVSLYERPGWRWIAASGDTVAMAKPLPQPPL